MKILIADDDPVSRLLLRAQLAKWGFDVVVACDGDEAWAALQAPDAPRLAILDWMMPGLDGPEVCRRLRADEAPETRVYAILLTGRDSRADLAQGIAAGADDYVAKPFEPAELELRLGAGRRVVELQAELARVRLSQRFEAVHDALTGALNRVGLMREISAELARALRERRAFSAVLVDLDGFKQVNVRHGHAIGDGILRGVARRIERATRPYDVLARSGDEEFCLVLPCCDGRAAAGVAERIRQELACEPFIFDGSEIAVTASLGVVQAGFDEPAERVVSRAAAALADAKAAGRDRVVLHERGAASEPA